MCIMHVSCMNVVLFFCFEFDDSSSGFLNCEFSSERLLSAETVGINCLPRGAIATATLSTYR